MPLDQKPQLIPGNTPPGSKKRKLSDGESPNAKPPKTHKTVVKEKPNIVENDPEVSSSSEAENIPIQNLKSRVRNTLERFVRKTAQEEITSTKDDITSTNECVDLTDSNDCIPDKVEDPKDEPETEEIVEKKVEEKTKGEKKEGSDNDKAGEGANAKQTTTEKVEPSSSDTIHSKREKAEPLSNVAEGEKVDLSACDTSQKGEKVESKSCDKSENRGEKVEPTSTSMDIDVVDLEESDKELTSQEDPQCAGEKNVTDDDFLTPAKRKLSESITQVHVIVCRSITRCVPFHVICQSYILKITLSRIF